jgi:hypothetical protein
VIDRGWEFKRGLDDDFINALATLASAPTWFADVIADPDLFIGIRDNYFNVYSKGQSLFKAVWSPTARTISVSTHVKYLIDPKLKTPIILSGDDFDIAAVRLLAEKYEGAATLNRMKRATAYYSGDEKIGLHEIVKHNPNIIDLEVALSMEAEADEQEVGTRGRSTVPRVDTACLEEIDGKIHLCFWEAKHYKNDALWSTKAPPVIDQVEKYRALVHKYKAGILSSYRRVAGNVHAIAKLAGRADALCPLVKAVAGGEHLVIDEPAHIGVIVFGYSDADSKSGRHRLMREAIENKQFALAIRGNTAKFKLRSARFTS